MFLKTVNPFTRKEQTIPILSINDQWITFEIIDATGRKGLSSLSRKHVAKYPKYYQLIEE